MSTNFWELLQQHQGDLTKSGRTVAEYLVQHAAEAQYLSISSLARECQVAEATVFRFCRALGFEGYHEMRIALAQANATGVLVNQQEPAPDADTATLCEHASALFMTAINGTQNALSPQAVEQAVALLHSARQVFCMGQGGSMVAASEICARFACITNKFHATADSHMQVMAASLMTEQDVVLFVSYSGATRDLMETLRTAKANGAKVILITNKGSDIHRILLPFFLCKKAAAPEKPARQLFLQEPVPALRDAPAAGTHLFTKDGNVVLLELFNAGIGQRVVDHLLQHLIWHGGNVCTGQCAVRDVDRIAHRGSDDLGMDIRVIAEHLCNGLNQVDAGLADIVQTPQKGADIGSTGTGSQQRLICAEDQGAVGGNALAAQHLDGLQTLCRHGDLHYHVRRIQCVDSTAFLDHPCSVQRSGLDLAGDGAIHNGGDLLQGLGVITAFLGDQAGVGGDTGNDAHIVCLADLVHVGRINVEFHTCIPLFSADAHFSSASAWAAMFSAVKPYSLNRSAGEPL